MYNCANGQHQLLLSTDFHDLVTDINRDGAIIHIIVRVTGDVPLEAGLDDGVNVGGFGGGGAGLDLRPHARF